MSAAVSLVFALMLAGHGNEARAAANGLIGAAETTRNPWALSYALLAYGLACHDADPLRAMDALRRGLVIAQDSGNRFTESNLASMLSRREAVDGDPLAALDHLTLALRNFHDSGNTTNMRGSLAVLAALFNRLGRDQPAATVVGFALGPFTGLTIPEITTAIAHLRDILGDPTNESLARKGDAMATAAMAAYAYDQIDQARTELEHSS